jgi:hypothetical protein
MPMLDLQKKISPTEFLESIYPDLPDGTSFLIWRLEGRCSFWYEDLGAVEDDWTDGNDVYFGTCLQDLDAALKAESARKNRPVDPQYIRGTVDTISAMGCLWLDLDVSDDAAHKRPNLPPSYKDALSLLDDVEFKPTWIVDSGHGLHLYWVFKEVLEIRDHAERAAAATLSRKFQSIFKAKAKVHGWEVDSTYDLARVLRLPGTFNAKSEKKEVRIIGGTGQGHLIESLADWVDERAPDDTETPNAIPAVKLPLVEIRQNATRPEKWNFLVEADPSVLKIWKHERRDFKDQSSSAYDMGLANVAAEAGWETQEICDLMVAHQREHGIDFKHIRYYQMTIAKAIKLREKDEALQGIRDYSLLGDVVFEEEQRQDEKENKPKRSKVDILTEKLEAQFGIAIKGLIKYTTDPATYILSSKTHDVVLGDVNGLIKPDKFRAAIAEATGRYVLVSKKDWPAVAQILLDICVEVHAGDEATDRGAIEEWLDRYLRDKVPTDDLRAAHSSSIPFERDEETYIFITDFRVWLRVSMEEIVTNRRLGPMLRQIGCEPARVRLDTSLHPSRVWRIAKQKASKEEG